MLVTNSWRHRDACYLDLRHLSTVGERMRILMTLLKSWRPVVRMRIMVHNLWIIIYSSKKVQSFVNISNLSRTFFDYDIDVGLITSMWNKLHLRRLLSGNQGITKSGWACRSGKRGSAQQPFSNSLLTSFGFGFLGFPPNLYALPTASTKARLSFKIIVRTN